MPVLIQTRNKIYGILTSLNRLCIHNPQQGFYRPEVDLREAQSIPRMLKQIDKIIAHLNTPHLSYLTPRKPVEHSKPPSDVKKAKFPGLRTDVP